MIASFVIFSNMKSHGSVFPPSFISPSQWMNDVPLQLKALKLAYSKQLIESSLFERMSDEFFNRVIQ